MALRTNVILTESILEDTEGTWTDGVLKSNTKPKENVFDLRKKNSAECYVRTFWNVIQNVEVLAAMTGDTSDKLQGILLETSHNTKKKTT